MYTDKDRELANDILGLVRRNSMVRNFEMYREMNHLYKRNDDEFSRKVRSIWKQLIALGLMNEAHGELTLTEEGMEAYDAEGGIQAYLKQRRKEKDLKTKVMKSQIWYNWMSVIKDVKFLIGALLGSVITGVAAWFLSLL